MKTTLIGTALITALLAGAASANSGDFGLARGTAPVPAETETFSTSDAALQPGERVLIPGTNMYYINDAANAPVDEVQAPLTPGQRLSQIMN